ncbi:MAG: hypothetical protein ABIQ18_24865 [Umezawaea sp.]
MGLDAVAARALSGSGEALDRVHRGITVLVSGIRRGHERVLAVLGVADRLRTLGQVFETTPEAIDHARVRRMVLSGNGTLGSGRQDARGPPCGLESAAEGRSHNDVPGRTRHRSDRAHRAA